MSCLKQNNVVNKEYKFKFFFADTAGSLLVESAFVFVFMLTVVFSIIDCSAYFIYRNKVESVSYSLATVFRERFYLYSAREYITQSDLDQLASLAETMLDKGASFCLIAEQVIFSPAISAADKNNEARKKIENYNIYRYGGEPCRLVEPVKTLRQLTYLSPWSIKQRWIPLYQITLAVPVPSGALTTFGALPEKIISSSVVLQR